MRPVRESPLVAVLVCGLAAVSIAGQATPPVDAARVHDLMVLIAAPDPRGAVEAARELQQLGPAVAPALVEALKTNPACQVQWVAAGVLRELQLEPALVETTLVGMARGACRVSSNADASLLENAAVLIVDRPGGIELLTAMLHDRDVMARRRAAVAFAELTARLDPQHLHPIAPTPEILAATEGALRPLRDVAVSKDPPPIRCVAFEAIDRARRLPHEPLRMRATSLLRGARVDCGASPGRTESGVPRTPVRREGLEEIIARLDRQPPHLAADTAKVLIAAPADDVVPLLQARLRRTDSCQGLALVAGVLASRHVAEADVDMVLDRVVAGQCAGREAFAMSLAQSAANALQMRPAGIARLTALLGDRDGDVRQRAATALGGLFAMLGMGEAARPTSDPAILAAAHAALPALVTLATTERDGSTRCEAVRAIQRAQEAQDAALRAEADAQSRGRTLRCLASPKP